jgi:dipeptidyl aminopeptidase/acylaminoacyl peptidase
MNKRLLVGLALAAWTMPVLHAQKPAITIEDTKHWGGAGGGQLSNDGNYTMCYIHQQPAGSATVMIQSADGKWKSEVPGSYNGQFSSDNRWAFVKVKDTLVVVELKGLKRFSYPGIDEFSSAGSYLIYKKDANSQLLTVLNLGTSKSTDYPSVSNYSVAPSGNCILLEVNNASNTSLQILDPAKAIVKTIWTGLQTKLGTYTWDIDGKQLAFFIDQPLNGKTETEFGYYRMGSDAVNIMPVLPTASIEPGSVIATNRNPEFCTDKQFIFFYITKPQLLRPDPKISKLTIWNYRDSMMQTKQLEEVNKKWVYAVAFNTETKRAQRIEQVNEKIYGQGTNVVMVENRMGLLGNNEANWNRKAESRFYLVSLKDGSRKLISDHIVNPHGMPQISPNGKWIIYYDFEKRNFFSYEVATGERRNISNVSNHHWENDNDDHPEPALRTQLNWLGDGNSCTVNDTWDSWMLDVTGKKEPVCLTNGYGVKNKIVFVVFNRDNYSPTIQSNNILFTAFDSKSKDNGFYKKQLGKQGDPEKLCMGPYIYESWDSEYGYLQGPAKAKDAGVYLVGRCSATESPNYFITKDFTKFIRVTEVNPQRTFNWLTTELRTWKSLDGSEIQGILYKPENFDPSKKYPVIFQYYEARTQELNLYQRPDATRHEINIPMFVSNGYIVFVPDIHFIVPDVGKSAFNAIVSAANYLSKEPWVDAKRMGLQGHSWGGFETGYVITHTDMFAAACSAAGVYDMVSEYTSGMRNNYSMYHKERGQGRFGKTLWENPEIYIENSSIFQANKLTTPLLMMHNKGDGNVAYQQSLDFFISLRRLGKRAWMLEYDNGDHSVDRGVDAEDFHRRIMQFFDHYLKGAPAPIWMTRGIPAKMKGITDGFEFDNEIKTPGPGLNVADN